LSESSVPEESEPSIDPRFTGGRLVRIAWARNPTEARLMQSVLLDAGIPSIDRPTRAFDILDLLATGPRDILVSEAAAEEARDVLGVSPPVVPVGSTPTAFSEAPSRLFAKLVIGLGGAAAIAWAAWQLFT
jgi:hypothetical protein